MNGRKVPIFCDDRTHVYTHGRSFRARSSVHTWRGRTYRRGGQARKGRSDRDGDFETCVMAFLVLSCIRTLTLLAYIRAWSWLPSTFLPSGNHIFARLYVFAVLCYGYGMRRVRIGRGSLRELTRWRQDYVYVYPRI